MDKKARGKRVKIKFRILSMKNIESVLFIIIKIKL